MLFPDETLTYAVARLFLKTYASDIARSGSWQPSDPPRCSGTFGDQALSQNEAVAPLPRHRPSAKDSSTTKNQRVNDDSHSSRFAEFFTEQRRTLPDGPAVGQQASLSPPKGTLRSGQVLKVRLPQLV